MSHPTRFLLITALLALTLAGCGHAPTSLSSGTYYAPKSETALLPPSLTLDMDKQSFVFTHDPLSSYLSIGTFTIDGDKLTAATDDGRYTYTFRLTGEDTLAFESKGSSLLFPRSGQSPADGTIFQLSEENDMTTLFDQYQQLPLDGSLLALAPGEITTPYYCYPVGAVPIGFEGSILYCFIPEYGDMVFAADPEYYTDPAQIGDQVYPLAQNFSDFLRLILACGSANPLEQIIGMDQAQFDQHLQAEQAQQTPQQKEALALLQQTFGLTPMEDPYHYVKTLQAEFDTSLIPYSNDYYDTLGLERPDGTTADASSEGEMALFQLER